MKIGLCTGGGDCPGLNAVIRAVVKHAIGSHNFEVWGIKDSFNGLMSRPLAARQLQIGDVTEILTRGGTILGTTNKGDPFLTKAGKDQSELVVEGYKQLGLDALIVIGGDGTQTIAARLATLGLNIVGIPKTIDNDLAGTDETVGFNTAVEVASAALERLRSTAESHDRIMLLEVMGRDAGHIALHAGIAGGANAILLPEIPFDYQSIVAKIEARKKLGRFFSIVVVAEGAYEKESKPVYTDSTTSSKPSRNLGGVGAVVAQELHNRTGFDTRVTVLGHIQRGGTPSPYDRVLASMFGVSAVDAVMRKDFGKIVVLNQGQMQMVTYQQVAGKSQPLTLDSKYIHTAESIGICLGRS